MMPTGKRAQDQLRSDFLPCGPPEYAPETGTEAEVQHRVVLGAGRVD